MRQLLRLETFWPMQLSDIVFYGDFPASQFLTRYAFEVFDVRSPPRLGPARMRSGGGGGSGGAR